MASSEERPVHVLTLLDTLDDLGGAEVLALELCERLDQARFRRTLFVTRWSENTEAQDPGRESVRRMRAAGVNVVGISRRGRSDLRPWRALRRYLSEEGVDIVHSHKFGSNAWAVLFGRLGGVPVVAHEHMWSYAESGRLHRFIDRLWIARGSERFIAVSNEGMRQMIEIEGVRERDITYVPNGVARTEPGDPAPLRDALGLAPDVPLIGTVANLRPEKALEVLVEASSELMKDIPEMQIVIAGSGPEEERLRALIAELGLSGSVHLLGYRDDVPNILASLDVAVCCSDFEGGPLSVMEYMEAALPVVATDVGGLPELIEDDVTGVLVPPRSPSALAEAIRSLLGDPDRIRRLGEAARERKRRKHDIDGWVSRMEAIFEEVSAR